MFTFLKTALRGRVVTDSDPVHPLPVSSHFRGKPEHHSRQCIGCAACVQACPSNALSVETDLSAGLLVWTFNLGRCIFCARCEEVCPTAAIRLSPDYELAVWDKSALQQQAHFPLCYCRGCGQPFAVQKEVDYVMALIEKNGEDDIESRRETFETCLTCRRQNSLLSGGHLWAERSLKGIF